MGVTLLSANWAIFLIFAICGLILIDPSADWGIAITTSISNIQLRKFSDKLVKKVYQIWSN